MKKIISLSLMTVMLIAITSCTTAKFGGLQMTKEMPTFEVVGDFQTEVVITKYLGSAGGATILNIGAENTVDPVYNAIQNEIASLGGDAAIDVEITYGANLIQMLLNSVTATIYAPATATITGSVVKY